MNRDQAIPRLEELNLPSQFRDIAMMERGLVIMTGGAGQGKSSSLAAIVGYRNALRAAPEVLLIDEIRDRQTLEHAIEFSETGHLCMAAMHANTSYEALERIVNFYPDDQRRRMLVDLGRNIRALISQRLIPMKEGSGRVAAVDIMLNTPAIQRCFFTGELSDIGNIVANSRHLGMQTHDQHLVERYRAGQISYEEALRNGHSVSEVALMIKSDVQSARERALKRLTMEYDKAKSADRDWARGHGNIEGWAALAFKAAIDVLENDWPSRETSLDYLARASARVRELRGNCPDADNGKWYDSTINEAVSILSAMRSASAETPVPAPFATRSPAANDTDPPHQTSSQNDVRSAAPAVTSGSMLRRTSPPPTELDTLSRLLNERGVPTARVIEAITKSGACNVQVAASALTRRVDLLFIYKDDALALITPGTLPRNQPPGAQLLIRTEGDKLSAAVIDSTQVTPRAAADSLVPAPLQETWGRRLESMAALAQGAIGSTTRYLSEHRAEIEIRFPERDVKTDERLIREIAELAGVLGITARDLAVWQRVHARAGRGTVSITTQCTPSGLQPYLGFTYTRNEWDLAIDLARLASDVDAARLGAASFGMLDGNAPRAIELVVGSGPPDVVAWVDVAILWIT